MVHSKLQAINSIKKSNFFISIAVPGVISLAKHFVGHSLENFVHFFHVMSYDYSGTWSSVLQHHSNLEDSSGKSHCARKTIEFYIQNGIDPHKLVLGVPFYSRGFFLKHAHQPVQIAQEVLPLQDNQGVVSLHELPIGELEFIWDDQSKAAFALDKKRHLAYSLETRRSLTHKLEFVQTSQLGGVMVWELGGDYRQTDSLLPLMAKYFRGELDSTPNSLSYAESEFDL